MTFSRALPDCFCTLIISYSANILSPISSNATRPVSPKNRKFSYWGIKVSYLYWSLWDEGVVSGVLHMIFYCLPLDRIWFLMYSNRSLPVSQTAPDLLQFDGAWVTFSFPCSSNSACASMYLKYNILSFEVYCILK